MKTIVLLETHILKNNLQDLMLNRNPLFHTRLCAINDREYEFGFTFKNQFLPKPVNLDLADDISSNQVLSRISLKASELLVEFEHQFLSTGLGIKLRVTVENLENPEISIFYFEGTLLGTKVAGYLDKLNYTRIKRACALPVLYIQHMLQYVEVRNQRLPQVEIVCYYN